MRAPRARIPVRSSKLANAMPLKPQFCRLRRRRMRFPPALFFVQAHALRRRRLMVYRPSMLFVRHSAKLKHERLSFANAMIRWRACFAALCLTLYCLAAPAQAQDLTTKQDKVVPHNRGDLTFSYAPVVKKAAPAVVNVYVRSRTR